jgi:acyl dehydratase
MWRLPGDLGRRYAAVSGDYNPIHLYPVTAKALGFPRHIAHGMWTLARSVAALENRLPDAVRVDVVFRKPVFLPGKVALGAQPLDDGYGFTLTTPGSDTVHLVGRTTSI